jgi:8-oxoguanine deaminase
MGTDTYPPDMIRVLELGVNMARTAEMRADAGDPAEMFRAATLGGAKALRRDDLGRLAVGALADMIIIDLTSRGIGVIDDPIRTVAMHCTGANVRSVIINGRMVMEDRELPGVDAVAMQARVQSYAATMKAAYTERDYLQRPTETLFRPSFRVV